MTTHIPSPMDPMVCACGSNEFDLIRSYRGFDSYHIEAIEHDDTRSLLKIHGDVKTDEIGSVAYQRVDCRYCGRTVIDEETTALYDQEWI